jgi:ribosomal protein S18 acetylase RimI-like enzyme
MSPEITIRHASVDDSPCLAVLGVQVWLHTYCTTGISAPIADYVLHELTEAKMRERLTDPENRVWVAEQGGFLLGFLVLNRAARWEQISGEVQTLYVQTPFLGRGIGHALLEQAQREAGQFWLTVNAQNRRAIDFYLRQGMQHIGDTHFVLDGVGYPNWVMASAMA